jgi:hypothetical protein
LSISKFSFKDLEIEHISKSTLKNYSISIKTTSNTPYIVIKTPSFTSKKFVLELLSQKEGWIRKKLVTIQQQIPLQLSEIGNKKEITTYLTQRTNYFAQKMQLHYSQLRFKNLKSRWGSCDSRKIITLNLQLFKVERELIDYVIVHELAHLIEMNHSKKFHAIVDLYIDNAKNKRKSLKQNYTLIY